MEGYGAWQAREVLHAYAARGKETIQRRKRMVKASQRNRQNLGSLVRRIMSVLRSMAAGLRSLFRKERAGMELDEELTGFLAIAAEEKMKEEITPQEALPPPPLDPASLVETHKL